MVRWDSLYYRPQRSWGKVIFLQASVILLTGGCLTRQTPKGQTPPVRPIPPGQTPQVRPPWADTPRSDAPRTKYIPPRTKYTPQTKYIPRLSTPPRSDPLGRHPPRSDTYPRTKYIPPALSTPPRTKYTPRLSTPPEIWSTHGRYASYWNAFLFLV